MIFVALVHVQGTVYVGVHKQRVVCQCSAYVQIIAHSMAFDVSFVDDVDAILVAQLIETFLLRVVAGADGVYVVALPELEVFQHKVFGNVMSGMFIVLMVVDAFHKDRFAVHHQLLVLYLYGAEAHFAAGGFDNVSVGVLQADDKCIEIRCFGRPLQWFFDCFWGELHFCLAVACACG